MYSIRNVALPLLLTGLSCGGGSPTPTYDEVKAAQEEKAEAEAKAEAERRVREREEAEAKAEQAYEKAKVELEPLATLPKKRPKGFGTACDEWLAEYDAFMHKSLEGDELTAWEDGKESRVPALRRRCHKRSVEAVVCQTQLLKKAPEGTDPDHMLRLCEEKF